LLFNSFEFFFVFLPIVLGIYYALPHRGQNAFLVLASCVFYASWDWRFLAPLLFTSSLDYWISKRLEIAKEQNWPPQRRKHYLLISVVSNLSLLGFFKYFNFFAGTLAQFLALLGLHPDIHALNIVLPVAISFYTFQALSYTIDVYRGELHATKSFWDFFLAVLYFPHLVAGPIQRASLLLPQVVHPRKISAIQVTEGLHLIAWGFCKKVFIADNLSPMVDSAFNNPAPTGGTVVLGVLAFTFQIYCDFSGYTDIARGIAKIMGFEFTLNFNLPYTALNPSDFWRRWHISLSSWLRDYLYKPLGGSRDGTWATYRNLLITMLLGGLWHGAAWNYILWGLYHGTILVLHRMATPWLTRVDKAMRVVPGLWPVLAWLAMFLMTCYGWLLFRATSLQQVGQMTLMLAQPLNGIDWAAMQKVGLIIAPLVLVQLIQWRSGALYFLDPQKIHGAVRTVAYAAIAYLTLFLGGQAQSFVYFQF
jgi:D-alanyl-lipoteichoic acid acyltransferase DltB (MBOAT superfamily)